MQINLDDQKDIAMIFAGIGTDYRKVINKLDKKEQCRIRELSQAAKDICESDAEAFLFSDNGKEEMTFSNWLSIYICDCVVYQMYMERGIRPKYLSGYSMGLITALVCGNAISFQDGAFLLNQIYNQEFKEEEGMCTIIGLNREQLEEMIASCGFQNTTFVACENNPYCYVISGLKKSNRKVVELAVSEGALKTYYIDSKFAFHTPIYQFPERDLSRHVSKIHIAAAHVPIVSCIDQNIVWKTDDVKEELIRNMYSKMLWEQTVRMLSEAGIKNYVEVGLGKSLTKISKRIDETNHFYTFDQIIHV